MLDNFPKKSDDKQPVLKTDMRSLNRPAWTQCDNRAFNHLHAKYGISTNYYLRRHGIG